MDNMEEDQRSHDPLTEQLVKGVMEELKQKKKSKKKDHQQRVETGEDLEVRKGKTFAQIEAEETGGTVREAEVGMAHTKRAVRRKGKGATVDDTELVANVEDAEEDTKDGAEEEANNGDVELTAFNLKEERETGYFDADGHYVERKNEDEEATDAWLESTEANMATAEVRRKHEERMKAMEAADAAAPLSESAIAELKGKAAKLMEEGETVTRALKRLGGSTSRKPVLKSKNKKKQVAEDAAPSPSAGASKAAFEELAELVDRLLEAGEMDVYTETKHQMEREAALYAKPTLFDSKPGDSDGDDMFAEDSDDDKDEPPAKRHAPEPKAEPSAASGQAAQATAPAAIGSVAAMEEEPATVDYGSWPVKELQRFLRERGEDPTGFVEKAELVAKVKSVAAAGPQQAVAGSSAAPPPGYFYHAESGYYWGAADSMYWDSGSGTFYSPVTQQWFTRDPSSRAFKPVAAPAATK